MSNQEPSVILGIDPGTQITGYAVIAICDSKIKALDFGCIRTNTKEALAKRYRTIFEAIEFLIDKFLPAAIAIETQFVQKNPQNAIKIGMARGMAMLAGARKDIPIFEYAPKKAKLAVVGRGDASKQQVQKMMQLLLGLKEPIHPEDAADALALALCHAHQMPSLKYLGGDLR